jgi:hypothetical protein
VDDLTISNGRRVRKISFGLSLLNTYTDSDGVDDLERSRRAEDGAIGN